MNEVISRREILAGLGAAAATATVCGASLRVEPIAPVNAAAGDAAWPQFPKIDPKLVAEVVGKSHFDENGVRELVTAHPPLVNACWDWGFGDYETPLGAASHTGRRAIAELLIERGARIDLFAAAMLGYTDVVKGFVTARPGVQKTLGPHGIPLLAHAKVGGEKAKGTFDYLNSLGDAGNGPETKPLEESERKKYVGTYSFGPGASDRVLIQLDDRGLLIFQKSGDTSRIRMHYLGNDEFFPAGVPTTKFAFDLGKSPPTLKIAATSAILALTRTVGA